MQRYYLTFCFVLLFIPFYLTAQATVSTLQDDEALIRQTIGNYFEGWQTGDTTKIGKAMHTTCKLKNIKDNGVVVYDRAKYLSFFKPRPRREAKTRIVTIDITKDIAAAKCEIELPKRLFTDYFNLMKVNGVWYIVDKVAISWER